MQTETVENISAVMQKPVSWGSPTDWIHVQYGSSSLLQNERKGGLEKLPWENGPQIDNS